MASIKYDADGFPIGELVKSGKDFAAELEIQSGLLRNIRTDVRSIARAVGAQVAQVRRSSTPAAAAAASHREAARRGASSPAGRAGSSRTAALVAGTPAGRERAAAAARSGRAPVAVAGAGGRDARGRFTAGSKKTQDAGPPGAQASPMLGAALSRLSDGVGRLSASISGAESVDANIAAANEVRQVVAPLGRGFSFLFSRNTERKKERWYLRFWKALTSPVVGKRGEQQPAAGPGMLQSLLGGMFGGVGGLLSKVPGMLMALLSRVLLPIAAVWGAWNLGQWIGGKIYEWLDKSGVMAKVLDAFDAVGETFSSAWNSVTSGIDTVVSGIEGAWKTITDGFKSALDAFMAFPNKIGEFFSGLDEAMRKIPVIGDAYAKAVDAAKVVAQDAKRGADEGRRGDTQAPAKSVAQAAGRDVGQVVQKAADAGAAVGRVVRGSALNRWAGGGKADIVGAAGAAGVDAGLLAQIAHFESGFDPGAKAGSSSAHGYGQFIDKTWLSTLNKHGAKYGVEGAGKLTMDQAKALRNDPKLQAAMLAELTKENVGKGRKLGGSNDAANVYALHNLGDGDAARLLAGVRQSGTTVRDALIGGRSVGDKERNRVEAVISNNKGLYGDGNISAAEAYRRMGTKMAAGNRFAVEARAAAVSSGSVAPAVTAGAIPRAPQSPIPSPVPSQIPPTPDYKEPPHQLNAQAREKVIVVPTPADPGQNVSDRALAHVVTGGIGS